MALFAGIATPPKVRQLQRTLYRKAKADGRWRAWSLYGDLCRRDVLETALAAVVRKAGAAGVDGVTTVAVETAKETFLDTLQTELREKRFRPSPVKRVWIPKADGKQRPLGVPTVKDRIVQAGLLVVLQPLFEADFDDGSFGYRPKRSAHGALDAIRTALWQGRHEVIDADLNGYFDTIDHAGLLRLVARRVSDGSVLALVKRFLKAPIVEEKDGRRTIRPNARGTPQGGVISPLLANLYLNSLDHGVNDHPELGARLVRYADDFVLLCRPGDGPALYERLQAHLQRKGLHLNETKTRVLDARRERFRFLGFEVSWRRSCHTGVEYPHVEPSPKAKAELRTAVRQELNHWTTWRSSTEAIRTVNGIVRGWGAYFHYANSTTAMTGLQQWLRRRVRHWLWEKYGRRLGPYTFFTNERLYGQYGLAQLPLHRAPNR
jgi:RNA-directed DNA polymerase